MIEKRILEIKKYLPLKITTVIWDIISFHIYGSNWSFYTLGSWRISTKKKVVFGCYDGHMDIENEVKFLENMEIKDVRYQTEFLKIDPVFILSNDEQIEIFSTTTDEPWTFQVGETLI